MGTSGDAWFPFCEVVLAPEREPHSCCCLSVCWLSPDRCEDPSDFVDFGRVNLWQIFAFGLAGLESAHGVSVNSSGKWDEEGHGQRTKPGEDQNTYTPVICPFTFLLTFPATTSSAKLCSLMSL